MWSLGRRNGAPPAWLMRSCGRPPAVESATLGATWPLLVVGGREPGLAMGTVARPALGVEGDVSGGGCRPVSVLREIVRMRQDADLGWPIARLVVSWSSSPHGAAPNHPIFGWPPAVSRNQGPLRFHELARVRPRKSENWR